MNNKERVNFCAQTLCLVFILVVLHRVFGTDVLLLCMLLAPVVTWILSVIILICVNIKHWR